MGKLTSKKSIRFFIFLCVSVYFFSYLTRINYAAIIVELVASEGITKTMASIVTTVAFVTYGTGQLISGYLGDRFAPRWLIFAGFMVTVSMNLLMPICAHSITLMSLVWGINGIAQAFMWPPLVKIMTAALSDKAYTKAVPLIGMGSASATIVIYLFSPVIINYLSWKFVFYIFGFMGFVAGLFWIISTDRLLKDIEVKLIKNNDDNKNKTKNLFQSTSTENNIASILYKIMPVVIFSIAVQGILRDGITTWVPSFISETFNVKSTISILIGVALPVFHFINNLVAYRILKWLKDDVFRTICLYFAVACGMLICLQIFGMKSVWLAVILLAATEGLICGVNLLQTAYIPKYFSGQSSVSTVCGLLNFSTYIGSALSIYLFAIISDNYGWNATVVSWVLFAAIGFTVTELIRLKIVRQLKVQKKHMKQEQQI